jgi:hypothetical protein
MKLFTSAALFLLSSSAVSAWKLDSDQQSFHGSGNQRCMTVRRQKDGYYQWDRGFIDPADRPMEQKDCCLILHDDRTCTGGRSERVCHRSFAGNAVLEYKSFEVSCGGVAPPPIPVPVQEPRRECRDRDNRRCEGGRDCLDNFGRECFRSEFRDCRNGMDRDGRRC